MAFTGVPTKAKKEKRGVCDDVTLVVVKNKEIAEHLVEENSNLTVAVHYALFTSRVLASTHFEPTSARMAFPCIDEPAFKANYSVRIRRGASHIALSNMPIVRCDICLYSH